MIIDILKIYFLLPLFFLSTKIVSLENFFSQKYQNKYLSANIITKLYFCFFFKKKISPDIYPNYNKKNKKYIKNKKLFKKRFRDYFMLIIYGLFVNKNRQK